MATVEEHFALLWRLLDPAHTDEVKRWIKSEKGIQRFHEKLRHSILPHPGYALRPKRGMREAAGYLQALRQLGAGATCVLISSDDPSLTGIVALDADLLHDRTGQFFHGTIFSCTLGASLCFERHSPARRYSCIDREPVAQKPSDVGRVLCVIAAVANKTTP